MPLTVITIKKVPKSLRGDLTKWMQEIATGVYVGNFNSKVREELWKRVQENLEEGEATLSYHYRNEIGYKFQTINCQREPIYFDGIPLVLIKAEEIEKEKGPDLKFGFSKAAKYRKAEKFSSAKTSPKKNYVVIDIETDGLDENQNSIIEIGAIKEENSKIYEFSSLIKIGKKLPKTITDLTGIRDADLEKNGQPLKNVLEEFKNFIKDLPLVGYNINFDIRFINKALESLEMDRISNKSYDLLRYVKKEKKYLADYSLETVIKEYGINKKVPHRALEDSRLTYQLSKQVNKFQENLK
ncbi:type I-E CRISPR-associated endoribonuclease Cas2e [Neofamilia massiliensis]|uniref:type I-E CRISPR-associated endoribonuclease Cas2e n=1 Tax=Neofamilia massiliensis TaxID=1673724 RepID=UPI0006BB8EB4|nr:type I-E CRISPR-associated endoribonuclease Cas2e [Neofamilia massiliensis]